MADQIYQQVYEECRRCEWEEADQLCESHDHGETYLHIECRACALFRDVVREIELAAGCRADESQPLLGELWQAVADEGVEKYRGAFTAKHPDLEIPHWVQGRGE